MDTVVFARLFAAFAFVLSACAAAPAVAQSADQEVVSAIASPDPVVPGQNVTYTVTLRNNGPAAAVNGGINVNFDLNLALVSTNTPPGFTCPQFGNSLSCITPSLAPGTYTITLVFRLAESLNAFPDGTFSSTFFPSGTTPDPNPGNNQKVVTTAYDSPQVDLSVSVADAPDPVAPDGTITYTVTATNAGPDPASNVNFNVFNNNSLRFQSAVAASGFTCALPPVGGNPTFTCSRANVPVGTYTFTVVLQARLDVIGPSDTTLSALFSFHAGASNETNPGNNSEEELTAYVTPDADVSVAAIELPDPVALEQPVEFLVEVANAGPDPATNTQLSIVGDGKLQFVSIAVPGGFTCTNQAVGATPSMTCSHPSLPPGPPSAFLVTLRADEDVLPNGGVAQTLFTANSSRTDPQPANNSDTETTTILRDRLLKDGFE